MDPVENTMRFFNYPQARKGPDVPYVVERGPNPVLRGRFLSVVAVVMEWFRFIREMAWHNAGFASLRRVRDHLADYDPHYAPTIVPMPISQEEANARGERTPLSGLREANPPSQSLQALQLYTVADYRNLYLSGELTPTDVARAILPLIRRDEAQPGKHSIAWAEIKADLIMRQAEASTLRYKAGQPLGPLDGIPSAIKDDYDLDGYATTLGSIKNYATVSEESSTSWCVRKLEEAGVVILGKLHMHEFGLGTPRNPFNPDYYTGGSSSGPGYAVGTGIIPLALGSDGGGSIRIPSSFCSVFGLKPTHERITSWPGSNHSPTCGVQGPIAIDMQSLVAAYEVVAEPHPSTRYPPLVLQPSPPVTKTLGIYEAWFSRSHPAVKTLVRSLVDKLVSDHGYVVVPIEIPLVAEGQMAHALTVLTDAATLLDDKTGITAANRVLLSLGSTTPATDYLLAQKLRGMLMQHLAYLWEQHPGMIIITPTTACAGWGIHGGSSELTHGLNDGNQTLESMEYVWLANFCGLPSLTAPAGYVIPKGSDGAGEVADKDTPGMIPVGLMATGEWCSEESLLQFGFDVERAGSERRCKPSSWEDIISKAREEAGTNEAAENR